MMKGIKILIRNGGMIGGEAWIPEGGNVGDLLVRGENGSLMWCTPEYELPEAGVEGSVLITRNGEAVWGELVGFVRYDETQVLSEEQKALARANLGVKDMPDFSSLGETEAATHLVVEVNGELKKLPVESLDFVTPDELEEFKKHLVTTEMLQEVENKIPTDVVTSEELKDALNSFTYSWNNLTDKPDATDALLVAAETGLIDPIAAAEGVFLVDSDGAILIL